MTESRESGNARARRILPTVAMVLVVIVVAVAGLLHRSGQPRVMSAAELMENNAFLLAAPQSIGEFELIDHHGQAFTPERLKGKWTLVFFGYTYCPDVCPTTLSLLNKFVRQLDSDEAEDTGVLMVSVDPARDTVEKLAAYIPFFNADFIGVCGEPQEITRFAAALNTGFRKSAEQGEAYQVDHSSSVVLINPRGEYHGFFTAPLDLDKMTNAYRSFRMWGDQ